MSIPRSNQSVNAPSWRYGWRFLNPAGGTNPISEREHYSVLPRPNEKWSDWTTHPNPATPDGQDCGPGRLHVMLSPSANYAPTNWWPWYCRWLPAHELGRSDEKSGVTQYQLRRMRPTVWWRTIRMGWWKGKCLRGANLRGADLRGANLSWADLRGADLRDAYLRGADLSWADLRGANLSWADLRGADLRDANLSWADLRGADLRDAYLRDAYLRGARWNDSTIWPKGFIPPEES